MKYLTRNKTQKTIQSIFISLLTLMYAEIHEEDEIKRESQMPEC